MSQELEKILISIDERLARLESKVDRAYGGHANQIKQSLAIAADSLDEYFDPSSESGEVMIEKVDKLKKIINLLAKDETLDSIETVIGELKNVAPILMKIKQLENTLSIFVDATDDFFNVAMDEGLDIEDFTKNLKKFSLLMTKTFESGSLNHLLESGILDVNSVQTVGALGKSMAMSSENCNRAGPLKVMGALFDPNIQQALGFFISFAQSFGEVIGKERINCKIEGIEYES